MDRGVTRTKAQLPTPDMQEMMALLEAIAHNRVEVVHHPLPTPQVYFHNTFAFCNKFINIFEYVGSSSAGYSAYGDQSYGGGGGSSYENAGSYGGGSGSYGGKIQSWIDFGKT